ncbi:sensor histidine kinase [Holdemania massiliensis]|uniref:sensor histidine kinase n=1 Tax=Holdemania massiliensis TaxID=1468449 RepID=UPI001F0563E4|nr:ATP-binding protein [Holdemania massiliensis]MCH1942349.1 HAMP domain-containing histidine kinase [Holdemania massiliensis]
MKLPLRMRITLTTAGVLSIFCILLTLSSVHNANQMIVSKAIDQTGNQDFFPSEPFKTEGPQVTDIARDTQVIEGAKSFTNTSFLFMGLAVLTGTLIVYFMSDYALKPIHQLSEQIEQINERDLSFRVHKFTADQELQSLAVAFNQMLSRLETAFQREKRFSSSAAHELKTPLTVIRTRLEVLELTSDPTVPQVEKALHVIRNQTERMISLVDDLFSLSSNSGCPMNEDVEVSGVIREIVQELRPAMEQKQLQVDVSLEMAQIRGNAVVIKHALSNVIENAVKYNSFQGRLRISLNAEAKTCRIRIQDWGPGILQEHIEHIFEPFYRVDSSRSRSIAGAGLGLALAKEMIELHQGTIQAETPTEGGSLFTITLPVHQHSTE